MTTAYATKVLCILVNVIKNIKLLSLNNERDIVILTSILATTSSAVMPIFCNTAISRSSQIAGKNQIKINFK